MNGLSEHVCIDIMCLVSLRMLALNLIFYSQFNYLRRPYSIQWSHCASTIQYYSRLSNILPVSPVRIFCITNKLCVWRRWKVESRSLPSGVHDDTNTDTNRYKKKQQKVHHYLFPVTFFFLNPHVHITLSLLQVISLYLV